MECTQVVINKIVVNFIQTTALQFLHDQILSLRPLAHRFFRFSPQIYQLTPGTPWALPCEQMSATELQMPGLPHLRLGISPPAEADCAP
jgi:hypothetical protein